MTEIKVSQLPEASEINDADLLMIVQSGTNKKITKANARFASGDEISIGTTEPTEEEKIWIKSDETTDQARYKDGNTWKKLSIKALDGMEIGSIIQFVGTTIPNGWLECDGSTITQSAYPELYDLIGGTLPDFRGRVLVGQDENDTDFDTLLETGGSKELQEHHHRLGLNNQGGSETLGLSWTSNGGGALYDNTALCETAGTGNSGNLQPYAVVKHIIKAKNTTPTMASIVNDYSESTTDGYSCDYENKYFGGVLLYNNSSGADGNITLDDSVANYSFIEIYYAKGAGSYFSNKVNTPDGKNMTLYCANNYQSGSLQELWKNITISGTSITSNYGVARNSSTTGTGNLIIENQVKIFKVVGYK